MTHQTILSASRPAGGSLGAAEPLPGGAGTSSETESCPEVVGSPRGDMAVAWSQGSGGAIVARAAIRPPGGSFPPAPATLSGGGVDPTGAAVRGDGDAEGHLLFAWRRTLPGPAARVEAAVRDADGTISPAVTVSGEQSGARQPFVEMDGEGNALAAWTNFDASTDTVYAAGFDRAPPRLSGVSIPAGGALGQALPFAAAALDVWGPSTVRWSFGDGAAAVGTAVTHAFTAPGTRTVSVIAGDARGNEAARSGTTKIAALPLGAVARPLARAFSMTHRVFVVGRATTAISAATRRHPVGTRFRFLLSRSAPVRIVIAARRIGRRVGRRCLAATRARRRLPRCIRYVTVGTLRRRARGTRRSIAFSGRIGRRGLRLGRYKATLLVLDSRGRVSARRSVTFTVVRR
jgi:hypothetical protein